MIKEFNIDVPLALKAVTLKQYQEWMVIMSKYTKDERDDVEYLKVKMLQIFCNLSIEDTYQIPLNNFDNIVGHISQLFVEEHKLITNFSLVDPKGETIEFGLIPKLDEMTFGEYVDLDKYINESKSYHKAMAVLFRPVHRTINGKYTIHEYKGSSNWSDYMLEMPVDVTLGALSFISRLQNELVKATLLSSQQIAMESLEQAYKLTSEENLDGFKAFTVLLKKMQLKSMMQ